MKYKLLTILALGLMTAFGGTVAAQQVVTGKLQSAKDSQPIPFANIAMMRASDTTFMRGVITDEQGVFNISNDTLPTVLRLSAMGYETQFVEVPNTRDGGPTGLGKIDMGTIVMHEGAMLLDVVKVSEKRPLYTVDGEKDLCNVAEDASIQTGNASDIFDWNSWGSTNINPYYTTISDSKYTSRFVTFGLTLRFGKMELESRAQTGAREGSVGGN